MPKKIIKNSSVVIASNACCAAIAFLCIPHYSSVLGANDFEYLTLFWTTISVVGALDFGVIYCLMISERKDLSSLFSKSFIFLVIFQYALSLLLFAVNFLFLNNIFNLFIFILLPICIAANISKAFYERQGLFLATSISGIVAVFISFALPLLFFKNLSLSTAAIFYLLGFFAQFIILSPKTFTVLMHFNKNSNITIYRLVSNGKYIFTQGLLNIVFSKFDRYLVSFFLGTFNYNSYYLANEFVSRLTFIPVSIMRVLMPRIVDSKFNKVSIKNEINITYLIFSTIGIFSISLLFLTSGYILRLWAGDSISDEVITLTRFFYVGLFFNVLAQIPYTVLQAYGMSSALLKIYCVELPFYFLLILVACFINVYYVAIIWSIRMFVDFLLLHFKMRNVIKNFSG